MQSFGAALALLACVLLTTAPALAGDKEEAEKHFRAGVSLQQLEDFDAAIAAFESSLRLYPTKGALFNLANCLRAAHRYPEALASFERLQQEFGDSLEGPMLGTVNMQLAELKNLTGSVILEVEPEGALVHVDGKPAGTAPFEAPVRLGLGDHELRVTLEGFEPQVVTFNLAPARQVTQRIILERSSGKPAPAVSALAADDARAAPRSEARPGSAWRTAGIATASTGAALIVAGSITGIWALSLDSDLDEACPGGHCPSRRDSDIDRLDRLTTTTNILLAVGGVTAVGGVVMWLTGNESTAPRPAGAQVGLSWAPGSVAASVTRRF